MNYRQNVTLVTVLPRGRHGSLRTAELFGHAWGWEGRSLLSSVSFFQKL